MNIRELTKEQLHEESLIDLAYAILTEKKSSVSFQDILKEIQQLLEITEEEMKERLVQFYTDLNIDGRFLLNNDNTWGLREWYKIETIEEETAPTIKTRKRKKAVNTEDDEDLEVDEEDLVFEEDLEEFTEEIEDEEELDDTSIDFVEDEIDELDEVEDDLDDVDEELIEEDATFLIDEDDDLDDEDEE